MRHFIIYLILLTGWWPAISYAQKDWEDNGEIEDVEIEIVKDREITLPTISRNFDKIPPTNTTPPRQSLTYFYHNMDFPLPDLSVRLLPLKIKDEKLDKLYGNFLKAGFGNYATAYAEGYFTSKRNKDYSYGAHIKFLNAGRGPVDKKNSGSGLVNIDAFGKYFTPKVTLSGMAGIDSKTYHFYGYPAVEIDEDTLAHNFNTFYAMGNLENTNKRAAVQYNLGVALSHLKDNIKASESSANFTFDGAYEMSTAASIKLKSSLTLIGRKDDVIGKVNRNIFKVRPTATFEYEGFNIEAGFNVVSENDAYPGLGDLHFYPVAHASYPFSQSISVYAGIDGDISPNTLASFVKENPYLASNADVYHTNKTFELYGGVEGKLGSKFGFGAGMRAANYKNMHYFVNNTADQSKFDVLYDQGNTALLNLFGQLSFNSKEALRLILRGDYWGYGTGEETAAWHKPGYKLSFLSGYNLYNKVLFNAEVYALGGITARGLDGVAEEDLDAAFDLNLKVDYLVSSQFSAFVQFNNIFNKEYQLLYLYPSRGLQFMVGATYSF